MIEIILFASLVFIFTLLLSYIFSLSATKKFIKLAKQFKFLGKDMNKIKKPEVAELGGIGVFISFILSVIVTLLFYFIFFKNLGLISVIEIVFVLLTMFLFFFMGLIDDIFGWKKGISQWQHFLYPLFFSVPIVIYTLLIGVNHLYIPIIGTVTVGLIYSWFLVPIAITATSNSFNLLAGYNGMEAGMSVIIFITIFIFAFFKMNISMLIILAAWIGALVGFLKYNKYPAKVFGGDVVTLVSGVLAGISAIILQLEILIAFLIILYIIEFIIKARHRFATECFGIIQKNGIIKPNPKKGSLVHCILRQGKFTEKSLVKTFYTIQIVISVISVFLFFLIYF